MLLSGGATGRAAVPSGASTGEREALELRDGDKKRYGGKGVRKAVANVNGEIAEEVQGADARDQALIDRILIELDGTPNKGRLGANAILGVSLAVCRAAAAEASGLPLYRYLGGAGAHVLPVPMMNVINGGAHADNRLDPQEFMICPVGFATFAEALRAGVEVFHALQVDPQEEGALDRRRRRGRLRAGHRVRARGARSAHGRDRGGRLQGRQGGRDRARPGRLGVLREGQVRSRGREEDALLRPDGRVLVGRSSRDYPIVSIEDGLAESDRKGWIALTKELGGKILLVGDDVFVTNPKILAAGSPTGSRNALLVKLNQVGTVTETLEAVRLAQTNGYRTIVSHRSGETTRRLDRGPRGRRQRRADQDRLRLARRAPREVQPAPHDRGRPRRRRSLRRPRGVPRVSAASRARARGRVPSRRSSSRSACRPSSSASCSSPTAASSSSRARAARSAQLDAEIAEPGDGEPRTAGRRSTPRTSTSSPPSASRARSSSSSGRRTSSSSTRPEASPRSPRRRALRPAGPR